MIDRDQLREALAKFDALDDKAVITVKSLRSFPAFEAARLAVDPDTLVITKVDGAWPNYAQNAIASRIGAILSVRYRIANAALDALLEGQPK